MSIKFYNLAEQYEDQRYEIMQAIDEVAKGGQYFADSSVKRFENLISHLYDGASCAGTVSGTAALTIALQVANLPKHSHVLIPAMTYVATANAVVAAGLIPVCVDINHHWLMDYDKLSIYLDKLKTVSAVVVVDLYGQGVDLIRYKKLCDHHKVKLIVDAAQSFEIKYDSYHQIDYCDSLAISFNPLKNLGAMGNAGAVVSKNYTVEQLKAWTHQGKIKNDIVNPGNNLRIDALQAAILTIKYDRFDDNMQRKSTISWHYRMAFEGKILMPERIMYALPTNYVFVVAPKNPEILKTFLSLYNVEFASHYEKPVHHYTAYKTDIDYCPFASSLAGRIISIPNHWHLTDDQVAQITEIIKNSV
jgi:UDP-2-acetamido-2-deoxy-ribo-hexuluronate aminotransferase